MGEVVAAYGVKGWLKIRTFTASPSGLLGYATWWLRKDDGWREFAVPERRLHGDAIVARLEGLQTRETAATWRGAQVAVPRAALPAAGAGEIYLADLIGLTVVNRQGATLGRVAGHVETGAHPVLRVTAAGTDSGERLIPLVPAYVDAIDLAAAQVRVDWPSEY
ncbi:MAG TPA: ribosome maturation factor RimM [Casimicrobiaceae bacterium]|nr:ribosome maturation factor RimM [Casimicrobiaceae bacterium]